MTDDLEPAESGNAFLDGVIFTVVTAVFVGAAFYLSKVWKEMFREKDREKAEEIER